MNNEMTLQNGFSTSLGKGTQRMAEAIGTFQPLRRGFFSNILRRKDMAVKAFSAAIAAWYSDMLEQNVTERQAIAMVKAQLAFFALILPLELGMVYRAAALALFASALLQCRRRMAE